nr:hypothetical protein [Sinorhizobium meliloti]
MYAAAKAKPQSIEVEHLGPTPISGPHLVATPTRDDHPYDIVRHLCRLLNTDCSFNRVVNLRSNCLRQNNYLRSSHSWGLARLLHDQSWAHTGITQERHPQCSEEEKHSS